MTYEEYTNIFEKIQDSLDNGSITMEAAEMMNESAYELYCEKKKSKKSDDDEECDEHDENCECDECKKSKKKSKKSKKSEDDEDDEDDDEAPAEESAYDRIVDSLQNAINKNAITFETANMINELAYERLVKEADEEE